MSKQETQVQCGEEITGVSVPWNGGEIIAKSQSYLEVQISASVSDVEHQYHIFLWFVFWTTCSQSHCKACYMFNQKQITEVIKF